MSCPDWRVLRADDAASGEVELARRHLAGCQRCRREALAFDASLLFSIHLQPSAAAPPAGSAIPERGSERASERAMVERMRERVAGARAMREAPAADRHRRAVAVASKLAAAVLLPLAAVGLVAFGVDQLGELGAPAAGGAFAAAEPAPVPPARAAIDPLVSEALDRLPLIEGAAPVTVQEEGIGYDLVMVVDAGLEL